MIPVLMLRLEAPLMSFGGQVVDSHGVVQSFPAASLLTGLIGNALGLEHRDAEQLANLQARLRFAARRDRLAGTIRDFQIVDLGQRHMTQAWTTSGQPVTRGGSAAKGLHIRHRDYQADGQFTVAMTLLQPHQDPTLGQIAAALARPARPLFIGRKACLPSVPILETPQPITASGLLHALASWPRRLPRFPGEVPVEDPLPATWPDDEPIPSGLGVQPGRQLPAWDTRDWQNQIHSGRRLIREGTVCPPSEPEVHDG